MPATEYRILMTVTFSNAADRDSWLAKIQSSWATLKSGQPGYKAANITAQDYFISTDGASIPLT